MILSRVRARRAQIVLSLALASAAVGSTAHAQAPAEAPAAPAAPGAQPAPAPVVQDEVAPVAPAAVAEPAPAAQAPVATPPADTAVAVTTVQAAPEAKPAEEPHARLDYSDGSFYFRSANDNLVLVPSGRVHIDSYSFAGPGVPRYHKGNGAGLSTNFFFRRAIIEMGGLIRNKWFFWFGGNFAPTSIDDKQSPISTANVYDGFIGYMPTPRLRIYFGQYNAPFTMENVTSSRWLDMMERALVIRTVATPYNKADGLMLWGDTENKSFEYQVGVFGGDGMNRPSVDNRVDGMARLVVRPLAKRDDALKRLHVGVGGRFGSRNPDFVMYDAPGLSTPGGYTFWTPNYKDATGAVVHVVPSSKQGAFSAEAYVPFERFDVRGEVVYVNENRREAPDADKTMTLRRGKFSGVGGYGQMSVWLLGTPRINGNPAGNYGVLKVPSDLGAQAPYALQLVARGEVMRLNYDANSRSGADAGGLSGSTTDIKVNAYQLGLNYWATKHIRLTAEYSLYQFPGSKPTNQAQAPGEKQGLSKDAHTLNEISFRVGLAL